MSTQMNEDDWTHTLTVFRSCLPHRGRKADDDRRFLEALHFFTVENVRWRALPVTVRQLEQRLEALRPFEQGRRVRSLLRHVHLHEFVGASYPDVRFHNCTRACVGRRRRRGQEGQALGRSRGGFTTKFHVKSNASGGDHRCRSDQRRGRGRAAFRNAARDRAGHSAPRRQLRQGLRQQGQSRTARSRDVAPVITHKANEKNKPTFFARTLYKARSRIDQGFGRLKRFKPVALRCKKTARNF